MSNSSRRNVSITGDIQFSNLKISEPYSYAGGTKALKVALSHMRKEVGLMKSIKTLNRMNQKEGFDCPGCAWADPEEPSKLGEYCENGAKAIAEEATFERVDREFFKRYSVEEISRWDDFKIGKSGRITEPFILRPGSVHYEPIQWDEAYEIIAKELHELRSPDEAIFYTSGRSSNEAAFLYGLFARRFGTNNMPDCSNMCHESSGVALSETLGIGKGSVTLKDFPEAEVIMVIGQNPGTNHPRMLTSLQECKKNGGYNIRFAFQLIAHRLQLPLTLMNSAFSVFDSYISILLPYIIALRSSQRWKDNRILSSHQMSTIQFRTHGYREITIFECLGCVICVWCGR